MIRGGRGVGSLGRDRSEATRCTAPEALLAHDPGHPVLAAGRSGLLERFVDPRRSVDPTALPVCIADRLGVLPILALAIAGASQAPGVVAAAGDLQDPAHQAYPEGPPVLLDEPELHFWSSAK
jgi:hypothetical protein